MRYEAIKDYYERVYREQGGAAFVCDRARFRSWLRDLPQPVPGARCLDIGCGAGQAAEYLTERGFAVTGIDISEQALAIARQRVPEGEFVLAREDASLQYPDATFDLVVCFGVLEHIPAAEKLTSEACRVARPGASALFVVPNRNSPYFRFGRGTGQVEENPRSLAEWRALFGRAGFTVRKVFRDRGPTLRAGLPLRTAVGALINRSLNVLPLSATYQFVFVLGR